MNSKRIIILISALMLMIVSVLSFSDDLFSPYVEFGYARLNPEKTIQIMGQTDRDSVRILKEGFEFKIYDEKNDSISVFHRGIKPVNFEHAEKVVAIGKIQQNRFIAEKILVKCPSKYTEKK